MLAAAGFADRAVEHAPEGEPATRWSRRGAPRGRDRRSAQDPRVPERVPPGLRPDAEAVRARADRDACEQAAVARRDRVDLAV